MGGLVPDVAELKPWMAGPRQATPGHDGVLLRRPCYVGLVSGIGPGHPQWPCAATDGRRKPGWNPRPPRLSDGRCRMTKPFIWSGTSYIHV